MFNVAISSIVCTVCTVYVNALFIHAYIHIYKRNFINDISSYIHINIHTYIYRVFIKYCVFSKNSRKFATSPTPALGCYWFYKNYQPMGVALHSRCVESFEGLLQQYVGEGGVAVNCEKTQFFLNTLYMYPRFT